MWWIHKLIVTKTQKCLLLEIYTVTKFYCLELTTLLTCFFIGLLTCRITLLSTCVNELIYLLINCSCYSFLSTELLFLMSSEIHKKNREYQILNQTSYCVIRTLLTYYTHLNTFIWLIHVAGFVNQPLFISFQCFVIVQPLIVYAIFYK